MIFHVYGVKGSSNQATAVIVQRLFAPEVQLRRLDWGYEHSAGPPSTVVLARRIQSDRGVLGLT